MTDTVVFNNYHAMLIKLNFHPLEVMSLYRDPQLQVAENSLGKITNICLIWAQIFANLDV